MRMTTGARLTVAADIGIPEQRLAQLYGRLAVGHIVAQTRRLGHFHARERVGWNAMRKSGAGYGQYQHETGQNANVASHGCNPLKIKQKRAGARHKPDTGPPLVFQPLFTSRSH